MFNTASNLFASLLWRKPVKVPPTPRRPASLQPASSFASCLLGLKYAVGSKALSAPEITIHINDREAVLALVDELNLYAGFLVPEGGSAALDFITVVGIRITFPKIQKA